jgi:DNA repair exonuclease SbcCD ATPase subunit
MSREFENAMCGYAARSILNADRPLARHEIFPKEGIFAGSLSKSWQNRILEWFVKDGHVTERKRNGVLLYEARDKAALADTARACPPIEEEEEEETPMRTAGYNKKEWDKWARVTVALRALKRLLASHQSDGDSAKWQPRTNIVYVRDDVIKLHSRNDKLNEKMRALHERIAALEEKLQLPTPPMPQGTVEPVVDQELRDQVQSVIVSVNSMHSAVNAMKQDVQQVVESSLHQSASDRVQQIQSSLARISSEFGALRKLALETFAEASR